MRACPSPLEVVTTEPTGHIDHFADEIQATLLARLHGLAGQLAGVDAARRDFGFFITFSAAGRELPAAQMLGELGEGFIAGLVDGALPFALLRRPALGQAAGHELSQFVSNEFARGLLGSREVLMQFDAWAEVHADGRTFSPKAGDLQYARAREAAMREEQIFIEARGWMSFRFFVACADGDWQGKASELRERLPA